MSAVGTVHKEGRKLNGAYFMVTASAHDGGGLLYRAREASGTQKCEVVVGAAELREMANGADPLTASDHKSIIDALKLEDRLLGRMGLGAQSSPPPRQKQQAVAWLQAQRGEGAGNTAGGGRSPPPAPPPVTAGPGDSVEADAACELAARKDGAAAAAQHRRAGNQLFRRKDFQEVSNGGTDFQSLPTHEPPRND